MKYLNMLFIASLNKPHHCRPRLLVIMALLSISYSYAQPGDSTCKVLLGEISASYKGGCKNGLADGKGVAEGEDYYVGAFKHGLPEGKGVYKYKNGNVYSGKFKNGLKDGKGKFRYKADEKVMVVSGYWKGGDYVGLEKPFADYRISNLSGIEYYSITKKTDTVNIIEMSFERVMEKYLPRDLTMNISSGYQMEQNRKIIIQNYSFPFTCELHFTIPFKLQRRHCFLTYLILNPGKYEVFISNN
jgi:hypothetical protein